MRRIAVQLAAFLAAQKVMEEEADEEGPVAPPGGDEAVTHEGDEVTHGGKDVTHG